MRIIAISFPDGPNRMIDFLVAIEFVECDGAECIQLMPNQHRQFYRDRDKQMQMCHLSLVTKMLTDPAHLPRNSSCMSCIAHGFTREFCMM